MATKIKTALKQFGNAVLEAMIRSSEQRAAYYVNTYKSWRL